MNSLEEFRDRPTILVVDDTPDNLTLMSSLLKDLYKVKVASNGEKALRIAQSAAPPDLILLDVMMPGMDGYEVCAQLKANAATREIPVIFLTARTEVDDEKHGLELGAVDYIIKPISPPIVLARVRTHLSLKAASDFLRDKNHFLEQEVEKRTLEVRAVQQVALQALASLAETRDNDTGNHIRRTQHYVKLLALKLKAHPRFREFLTDANIDMLFRSSPLHDVGKVGIPDRILFKPDVLNHDEFEIMKTHARIGWNAISNAEKALGVSVVFLRIIKEIALSHHEKWDGSGYPEGLSGEAIPISARLMAVADVYDAMISQRVYRPALAHEKVAETIINGRGTHFDPDIVDAFIELQDEFQEISRRFADSGMGNQLNEGDSFALGMYA